MLPITTVKLDKDRPTGTTVKVLVLREHTPEVAKQVVLAEVLN